MGGGLSLSASCRYAVDATIVYYGGNPNPLEQVENIPGAVLGIYGEDDRLFPDAVNALRDALTGYGKSVEIHTYPGAPHAFFNDSRPRDLLGNGIQRRLAEDPGLPVATYGLGERPSALRDTGASTRRVTFKSMTPEHFSEAAVIC